MNSAQFIKDAIRTEARPESLAFTKAGTLGVLKVLIEAAKIADTCKRALYYGKPLDVQKLGDELETLGIRASHVQYDLDNDVLVANGENESGTALHEPNMRLLHGAIGIFSEAGEMLEALDKQMRTGELDKVNFGEETGDVDWYKAVIHDDTGVGEETTRAAVIAKLKKRYPEKFDSDAAVNRDLAAERATLEQNLGEAA